jgi:hypothetical protein
LKSINYLAFFAYSNLLSSSAISKLIQISSNFGVAIDDIKSFGQHFD